MMHSAPSSPPTLNKTTLHDLLPSQQQHQQHPTRQRAPLPLRLGGDHSYRDDPTANAFSSMRPDTFRGRGGGAAATAANWGKNQQQYSNRNGGGGWVAAASYDQNEEGMEKPKSYSLGWTRSGRQMCQQLYRYCQPAAGRPSSDETLYYEDHFNDMPWQCQAGTSDDDGIWLNQSDLAGTIMSVMVWVLFLYSALTMTLLAETGGIPANLSMLYSVLTCLALACHAKTTLTDPGAVPASAVPTAAQRQIHAKLSMCSQCQTFKPPLSHHCRICNRCISKMDHHCPWMNNCVGAGNLKHFCLFLIYTWSCSVMALTLLGWNYFFCAEEACAFTVVLTQLVRLMTPLSVGSFLFTSSMLMNVVYGIMTGIGTIDRLKKKATGTMGDSDEESIPLSDIFGIGPYYTWWLPTDPIFEDYDRVMGFATPQRLLREQMREGYHGSIHLYNGGSVVQGGDNGSVVSRDSFGLPV